MAAKIKTGEGKNAQAASRSTIFFSYPFKFIRINLKEEVKLMTSNNRETQAIDKKEEQEQENDSTKGSCGCGCVPPIETK